MLVSLMKGTGHRSVELPNPPKGLVVWNRLDPVFRKGNTKSGIWAMKKDWLFRVYRGYPCFVVSIINHSKGPYSVGPKLSQWYQKIPLIFFSLVLQITFHEKFRPKIPTQNTLSEGSWSTRVLKHLPIFQMFRAFSPDLLMTNLNTSRTVL